MGISAIFLVLAIICFILQAIGVQLGKFQIGWIGLAFVAGAMLV